VIILRRDPPRSGYAPRAPWLTTGLARTSSPNGPVTKRSPRSSAASTARPAGRRIQVRKSGVHGKGVFALKNIPEGEMILEYVGEIVSWAKAQRRRPHNPDEPNHTFYFHIDDENVIDAFHGGNASRWINHSCDANCEAEEVDGRVFIRARRDIVAGEELNYDYGLVIDARYTPKLKAEYPCACGTAKCRGTLLAPKRGGR
jgi:SET domain-containing protein